MDKQKQLPPEMHEALIEALENGDVRKEYEAVFDEKTTFISVEDYEGEAVAASYDFYIDDVKSSAPEPCIIHRVTAAGLKFVGTQADDEYIEWELDSDEYFIPDCYMSEIEDLLNEKVEIVDPWDCQFPEVLSEEWEKDEVIEDICSKLEHEKYIEFEDNIYPLPGSVEDFMDDYNTKHGTDFNADECDYTVMTPDEVAERLADDIYY